MKLEFCIVASGLLLLSKSVMKHQCFMHGHLHAKNTSSIFLNSILHTNYGLFVTERAVELYHPGLFVTFAACYSFTIGIDKKKPATKFEEFLTAIVLKLT